MDLIERQEAIKAIKEYRYTDRFFPSYAVSALKELPSADAEPVRHGHWSIDDTDWFETVYRCTVCKKSSRIRTSYCPNCGAKMDEVKEK